MNKYDVSMRELHYRCFTALGVQADTPVEAVAKARKSASGWATLVPTRVMQYGEGERRYEIPIPGEVCGEPCNHCGRLPGEAFVQVKP